MNLASYQLLQPAMYAAYLHRRAAFLIELIWIWNTMNYFLEETEDSNPHLTTIRTVSSSCRCASNYTSLLWVVIWMMKINHLFGFFRTFPCSPDCNVFGSACTDNSSFRCSPSAYLMQISWIFVCRASFRQVTASIDALQLLLLHAYYFCASTCQRTIFHVRSMKLSSDARLSLPERPTL